MDVACASILQENLICVPDVSRIAETAFVCFSCHFYYAFVHPPTTLLAKKPASMQQPQLPQQRSRSMGTANIIKMMIESCCVSPEKFIDRSSSEDVDDQDATPTRRVAVISYVERNSKKLLLLAAAFALIGAIGVTSRQSKQLAKKGTFSLGKKASAKSAKGLRGSSKTSKSSKTSSSRSRKSDTQKDLGLGNSTETTLVDTAAPDATQPLQQEDADLIQAGMADEFVEGSFLEEEMVDISDTSEEEAASTMDGLLDEPAAAPDATQPLQQEDADLIQAGMADEFVEGSFLEEEMVDISDTSEEEAASTMDGLLDEPSEVAEVDDRGGTDEESSPTVEETSVIIDVGEESSTMTAAVTSANVDEEEESSTEAAAEADGDVGSSMGGDAAGGSNAMGESEAESVTYTDQEADEETASLSEAADAHIDTDAETTSVTEDSDSNPGADAETGSVSETADANTGSQASDSVDKTGAETASLSQASGANSDADAVSATTEENDQESALDADNASNESLDTMTSSESGVNGDDSGTSTSASNLSGGDNTSSSVSSSSSNVNEDDGSSSNGSNGTSDNTNDAGNTSSSSGSNTTGGDNTSSVYGDDNGSSSASSETESESIDETAEVGEEEPTAEENVTTSENYVNLATKNIGSDPARSGFLSMLAIGTVAFFAVGLYTNLKNKKKEAAAGGGGGNLDPLEDDSSIWSANEDVGDMAGPGVSGLAAMGANSTVAVQLSGANNADASVVSGLTE